MQVSWSAIQACPRKYAFTCQNHVLLGFKLNIIKFLYMGSIKLKLASKTKNRFYSSNMYLTYLES